MGKKLRLFVNDAVDAVVIPWSHVLPTSSTGEATIIPTVLQHLVLSLEINFGSVCTRGSFCMRLEMHGF